MISLIFVDTVFFNNISWTFEDDSNFEDLLDYYILQYPELIDLKNRYEDEKDDYKTKENVNQVKQIFVDKKE